MQVWGPEDSFQAESTNLKVICVYVAIEGILLEVSWEAWKLNIWTSGGGSDALRTGISAVT